MKNRFARAFLSSLLSITPIVVIVFLLSLFGVAPIGTTITDVSLGGDNYLLLGVGAVVLIVGLALFQVGASNSLVKVGEYMGTSLSKQKNLWIVIIFAFLLGTLITCAEPSILIISNQVQINKWILIGSIAAGVGIFVVIGILRVVYNKSLNIWYLLFYLMVFLMICILQVNPANHVYLPFIFDAGGVTTGSATVPFILALGAGVAMVRGRDNSRDSSFGLVGLASIGPILTMVILIMVNPAGFSAYQLPNFANISIIDRFLHSLLPNSSFTSLGALIEVIMALTPILVIFFIYELIYIKLSAKKIGQLMIGFLLSFVGLTFFLTAVGATMSPIGLEVGQKLANQPDWIIIIVAFVIGMVTILCEPAVHVLTTQIEEISDGQIKRKTVLFTLSIGVGIAIGLSFIRTLYNFSIIYIIVPGYLLSFVLMFLVPDLYTAIAFDSGGTASGPMAVSFILPMIIGLFSIRGAANPIEGDVVTDGVLTESLRFYNTSFGAVALIAMTPIIAIQILGLVTKFKSMYALKLVREQIEDVRNNEIIHFN